MRREGQLSAVQGAVLVARDGSVPFTAAPVLLLRQDGLQERTDPHQAATDLLLARS